MSYNRIGDHRPMMFDTHRNEAYARAIRRHVRPDSVVLDLGAGMGLHGLLAAAAGARRVYLVEPQPVVQTAVDAARAAGLADRITVIQERIEDTTLPAPVDLIVSVFTGNLLFSEDLLPSLFHARERYLAGGGAMVPDRAQLWLAPWCAPGLHRRHVACWSDPILGLDYSASRAIAANEILWLRRGDYEGGSRLAEGGAVADIDLASASDAACDGAVPCRVERAGDCHGLVAWIRIRVGEDWLSSEPGAPDVHWSPVFLPIDPPLATEADESLLCTLKRPAFGDWSWSIEGRRGTRSHSSFLAGLEGSRELARSAPTGRPGLGARGERALRVLQLMREGWTNQAIADALQALPGEDAAQRLRDVQQLARRYGGKA